MAKRTRTDYSPEFKMETVRAVRESGKTVTQLSRELGIPRQLLHAWDRAAEKAKSPRTASAFPGKGKLRPEDAELDRLRKENAQLKRDLEIVKKATAFFAKNSR